MEEFSFDSYEPPTEKRTEAQLTYLKYLEDAKKYVDDRIQRHAFSKRLCIAPTGWLEDKRPKGFSLVTRDVAHYLVSKGYWVWHDVDNKLHVEIRRIALIRLWTPLRIWLFVLFCTLLPIIPLIIGSFVYN